MSDYEEIRTIIEANGEIVEFGDYGQGIPPSWIPKAEAALNIAFPPSYKWWLLNYGGGEIGGEEIYSLYQEEPGSVVGGDIVSMHRSNQKRQSLSPSQVAICHSDTDGVFYFETSQVSRDGEYPVISAATGTVYGATFLEFLQKRIEAFIE